MCELEGEPAKIERRHGLAAGPGRARRPPRRPRRELTAAPWSTTATSDDALADTRAHELAAAGRRAVGAGLGGARASTTLAASGRAPARDRGHRPRPPGRASGPRRGRGRELRRARWRADVDAQRSTPLAVVRAAVSYPDRGAARGPGCRPCARDPFATERFPDDPYGLTPASLAAVDPTSASRPWPGARPRPWPTAGATRDAASGLAGVHLTITVGSPFVRGSFTLPRYVRRDDVDVGLLRRGPGLRQRIGELHDRRARLAPETSFPSRPAAPPSGVLDAPSWRPGTWASASGPRRS